MTMPVYNLYFSREMDLTVEAESREAAFAAGENACDDRSVNDLCGLGDRWTVEVSVKPAPENYDQQGIKNGRIVHISDAERGENDE